MSDTATTTATSAATFNDICIQRGLKVSSVATAYRRKFSDREFDRHRQPTADEYSVLFGDTIPTPTKRKSSTATPTGQPIISPAPATAGETSPGQKEEEPKGKKQPWITTAKAFRGTMILVCVSHSVLVAYGLKTLFPHGEGLIAGCMALLVVIACLIIAHASELPRTSYGAAWLVTLLDFGAWFVHYRAFQAESPEADPVFIGCLSGFICLMAMWSVWLVRDSKIV